MLPVSREGWLHALRRERQRPEALAGRVSDRIGDRRGRRALRALADTEEALARAIDENDLDLRHFVEPQDRVIGPRSRGSPCAGEAHGFLERPARRLDDAALDLVDHAVRVDDLSRVDRRDRARHADASRRALDLDVGRHRAVAREVLVSREGEAAAARAVTPGARLPTCALRRGLDDGTGTRVARVTQAELHRI